MFWSIIAVLGFANVSPLFSAFTCIPAILNEYLTAELNVRTGCLKALSFVFEYVGPQSAHYVNSVVTMLEDALTDRDLVHRQTASTIVKHLALGVAGMGGKNTDAYDDLKQVLFSDSAVAGEAAGYAMGLILLGTADEICADEMLVYARETQHEKIIRGLAIGIAFIYYGRQEQADSIVKQLLGEKVC